MYEVNFDMDGTLVDLYGVTDWLEYLLNEQTFPYENCKPLVNFSALARRIHKLQAQGYKVNIISWLSKNGSDDYNRRVASAKRDYLKKHLPSVTFDRISIVKYGTPKSTCGNGILFDDEECNRLEWNGIAYNEKNILEILKTLG